MMTLNRAADRENLARRPRVGTAARILLGSRCRECGTRSWPGRAICHRCGSADVEDVALAGTGVLQTFTTVHVARPGLPVPYVLGQVRLDDGVRVYAHVRALPADARVPLAVRACFADRDDAVPPFWFEPASPSVA